MPRPIKCRNVANFPKVTIFKPNCIGFQNLESVCLGFEELESLRLADYEGKKQEEAALLMNVSRATFGRIVEKARYNVADALLNGKAIVISGGEYCHYNINKCKNKSDISEINNTKQKKCQNCPKYKNIHGNFDDDINQ